MFTLIVALITAVYLVFICSVIDIKGGSFGAMFLFKFIPLTLVVCLLIPIVAKYATLFTAVL